MEIENNNELDLETLDKEDVDIYQSEYTGVEIDAAIRNSLALGSEEDVKDLKQNVYNIKASYTNHITADNPHGVTAAQVGARPDTWTPTAAEVGAAPESHLSDMNNPHEVTASQVGLGNVDNTSDKNKPISTKQQAALDLKADKTDLDAHIKAIDNPHKVTIEQIGAAPAGYGLGEEGGHQLTPDTIDTATLNGIYYYYDANYNNLIPINGFTSQRGTVVVTGNARYKTQTFISNHDGKVAQRSYTKEDSGEYGPWRLATDTSAEIYSYNGNTSEEAFEDWLNNMILSMPVQSMRFISTGHFGAQKLGFVYNYNRSYVTVDLTEQGTGSHFVKVKNNGVWQNMIEIKSNFGIVYDSGDMYISSPTTSITIKNQNIVFFIVDAAPEVGSTDAFVIPNIDGTWSREWTFKYNPGTPTEEHWTVVYGVKITKDSEGNTVINSINNAYISRIYGYACY